MNNVESQPEQNIENVLGDSFKRLEIEGPNLGDLHKHGWRVNTSLDPDLGETLEISEINPRIGRTEKFAALGRRILLNSPAYHKNSARVFYSLSIEQMNDFEIRPEETTTADISKITISETGEITLISKKDGELLELVESIELLNDGTIRSDQQLRQKIMTTDIPAHQS